jgi:murein DD-endopeptidase MepM/ murein hydrolase activator NlpD
MSRALLSTLVAATGATVIALAVVAPGTAGRSGAGAGWSHARTGADTVAGPPGVVASAPGAPVAEPPARPGSSPLGQARWRWPIRPRPPVLRPFRAPPSPYAAGHRGLDLATVEGAVVRAVEAGTVTHAGMVAGRGTVTVTHSGGLTSTYEAVGAVVAAGDVVSTGDVLGTVMARGGPEHCGSRVCLHLGARRAGSYLDPRPLLAGGRLALLPLR